MSFDTQTFRKKYRANISPYYNPWLHAGFVLVFGVTLILFLLNKLDHVSAVEWLTVPATLIFFSSGEYRTHKGLGHNKKRFAKAFYQRHTGDHHSFFADDQMRYEFAKDWRVILFPAWLIVVYSIGALLAWSIIGLVNANVAALFAATLLGGYLSYEIFHACEHLPPQNPICRLPWIRHMRRLHELHHRRDLMQTKNFAVVFPLWDWIYGTLHWEPEEASESLVPTVKMQHSIDIARTPSQVLAYVSTPLRWHEWHPYHVAITGQGGSLPVGSHFAYVGGRAGKLQWEVVESLPDRLWRTRARGNRGLEMFVTYECIGTATGTRFVRTLEYRFSSVVARMADRLVLRKRIERDSVALLHKLRSVSESVLPAAETDCASKQAT